MCEHMAQLLSRSRRMVMLQPFSAPAPSGRAGPHFRPRADFPPLSEKSDLAAVPAGRRPQVFGNAAPHKGRHAAILEEWMPLVERLSLPNDEVSRAAHRAVANGTGFVEELLASGRVDEGRLFEALAHELGLPFLSHIDPERLQVAERHRLAALASRDALPITLLERPDGTIVHVLAHLDVGIASMRERLARMPELAGRLCIAPPGMLRAALIKLTKRRLLFDAQYDLFLRQPDFSANIVANAWQGACIGAFLVAFPLCLILAGAQTIFALHLVATIAFFACIALRLLALSSAGPLRLRPLPAVNPKDLPVYSVLVALYSEREVIPQLLVALGKLQWPHAKLEIKLVCEEDDHETLAALRAHHLRPFVEIVEVPAGGPRTKPKALAYALPLCSGELVTLYDAEDRPHPMQLMEAWYRFSREGEDLACLQAPLVVTNGSASPFSRMFAFEYAGLFRGLLPWLAGNNLLLPLGGTSNHFRRSALADAGGWDAYNVTEDADLGLRFKRLGYRTGVLTHPTFEDGPEDLQTWLPQRVRWFKGWVQTWLVHMRSPRALWRDLGSVSFLVMQVLFLGMLVSALIHPLFLVTIAYVTAKLVWTGSAQTLEMLMLMLGFANILFGYGAFIAIGAMTLSMKEKGRLLGTGLLTPLHWVLLSVAAWLALWEIYRKPHHWNKTHHRRTRSMREPAADGVSQAPAKAFR